MLEASQVQIIIKVSDCSEISDLHPIKKITISPNMQPVESHTIWQEVIRNVTRQKKNIQAVLRKEIYQLISIKKIL